MTAAHEEIQLSWLRAFLAVYNTGSFTAAARHVHRAQSRVSAQVAQLEHHLGMQLFVRGRLPTCLTEAGHEFLPYAQGILHQVEAGASAVASRKGMIRGRVTVTSGPGVTALFLAPFLKRFCERHPHAEVDLRDAVGHDPEASVVHSDVDLAVRATEPPIAPHSLLLTQPLFREPIVCLLPAHHPAAKQAYVTPAVFTGENAVMTGEVTSGAGHYTHLLASSGAQPKTEKVVGQPTTVAALVDAGVGIGVMPALAARLLDTGGRARPVAVDGNGWMRDIVVLTNRSRRYPPVVETFIEELLAAPLHHALHPPADPESSR